VPETALAAIAAIGYSGFLMRRDVRFFDHVAPDGVFFFNESGGLGRAAAGGLQVDLGEVGPHLGILQYLIDRLVELGDDGRWGLRRCGDGIPSESGMLGTVEVFKCISNSCSSTYRCGKNPGPCPRPTGNKDDPRCGTNSPIPVQA